MERLINTESIVQLWDRVRTSLWFVPSVMVLGALGLAIIMPVVDGAISDKWIRSIPLVFSGRAVGARAVLTTIATSMIAVAGVVFSMTIVSLQLASTQFGPRLLRTFLRDRGNQIVLGTFLGTFVYCVTVLPAVDTAGDSVYVPHLAVTLAVLQSLLSLGMLVYYIDHVAQSIHADAVMDSVGQELESVIDELFPNELGDNADEPDDSTPAPFAEQEMPEGIRAAQSGYIRYINGDRLLAVASKHDLAIRATHLPGDFALGGSDIADVWPAGTISNDVYREIRAAFVFGAHRTTLQDVRFAFEQLSEMAMRAMSPSINDPTTAIHCIDRIGSGLVQFVTRETPSRWRSDENDTVRLEIEPVNLEQILDATVVAIARTAGVHLQVWVRLLSMLEASAHRARKAADRTTLRQVAVRIAADAEDQLVFRSDHERLERASQWVRSQV